MFERYTEKARRVIFFARYEASQYGAKFIEAEHLLLGLLHEAAVGLDRFGLDVQKATERTRELIEAAGPKRAKISTSVDLPLSNECKRILAYAAEEAERLSHMHIGPEHLLLGMLREEECMAHQVLSTMGIQLEELRDKLIEISPMAPQFERRYAAAAQARVETARAGHPEGDLGSSTFVRTLKKLDLAGAGVPARLLCALAAVSLSARLQSNFAIETR